MLWRVNVQAVLVGLFSEMEVQWIEVALGVEGCLHAPACATCDPE
jgi:hypothetical protein